MDTNNNRYGKILLENELDQDDCIETTKSFELSLEQKKEIAIDQILDLYDHVFSDYRHGKKLVYNPFVFSNLTRNQFVGWVINHNTKLYKLFNTHTIVN